jgi:excisionase family DNA binding protein
MVVPSLQDEEDYQVVVVKAPARTPAMSAKARGERISLRAELRLDRKWLRVRDVAKGLDVPERTVRYWAESGALKGVKVGPRIWRITEADLNAFVHSRSFDMSAPHVADDHVGDYDGDGSTDKAASVKFPRSRKG